MSQLAWDIVSLILSTIKVTTSLAMVSYYLLLCDVYHFIYFIYLYPLTFIYPIMNIKYTERFNLFMSIQIFSVI